jgi:hypothetical protein
VSANTRVRGAWVDSNPPAQPPKPALLQRVGPITPQMATISECRYRWFPATTFVITRSPSRSVRRDGCGFSRERGAGSRRGYLPPPCGSIAVIRTAHAFEQRQHGHVDERPVALAAGEQELACDLFEKRGLLMSEWARLCVPKEPGNGRVVSISCVSACPNAAFSAPGSVGAGRSVLVRH